MGNKSKGQPDGRRWRRLPRAGRVPAMVYGCHGGAGASTIAALTGAEHDVGRACPPRWISMPLVVVARRTAQGCRLLSLAVAQVREMGYDPIVAAVGDGPWPDPESARMRLRMLTGQGIRTIRLPYVAAWRFVDDPSEYAWQRGVPYPVYRAVGRIRAAVLEHRQVPGAAA